MIRFYIMIHCNFKANYINNVSTFPFFIFYASTLFLLNQVSKTFYFLCFGVSTLFLLNQMSKLYNILYFRVSILFLFNRVFELLIFV